MKANPGPSAVPHPTAPLGSRSRARLDRAVRAAAAGADGRQGGLARGALTTAWLVLAVVVAATLALSAPTPREPAGAEAGAIQRFGPAEDDTPAGELPGVLTARSVALAPAEEPEAAPPRPGGGGLYLATGGPAQPLRAAPDRTAAALVQVPDHAALDDLGSLTPDGAWRRVAWGGWEGWIAAGLLRRRAD